MIVDLEYGSVIATPTKCGTTSIEALARSRGSRLGLTTVRPRQHRMVVPDEYANFRRYMMVRNPYDRLASIYLYLSNPSNYSQWAHWEVVDKTFTQFLYWYVRMRDHYNIQLAVDPGGAAHDDRWYKSPNLWLVSLGECMQVLQPQGLIRLENLEADLKETGRDEWGGKMLHSNRSTNRKKETRAMYGSKQALQKVNQSFLLSDCERLGYEPWL